MPFRQTIASRLQVGRLKWLQAMAAHPEEAVQTLAALHAKLPWDRRNPVTQAGQIHDHSPAHLQLLLGDVLSLAALDPATKAAFDLSGWWSIFSSPAFCKADPDQLLSFEMTEGEKEKPEIEAVQVVCRFVLPNGHECGHICKNHSGLAAHERREHKHFRNPCWQLRLQIVVHGVGASLQSRREVIVAA